MKFSIRSLLLCLAISGIVAALIASDLRHRDRVQTAEAQVLVALLVCDYLDENDNEWPKSWSDLDTFNDQLKRGLPEKTLRQIQECVSIDFTIDGSTLLELSTSPKRAESFKPIRPKFGDNRYQNEDPNLMVLEHVGRMITY